MKRFLISLIVKDLDNSVLFPFYKNLKKKKKKDPYINCYQVKERKKKTCTLNTLLPFYLVINCSHCDKYLLADKSWLTKSKCTCKYYILMVLGQLNAPVLNINTQQWHSSHDQLEGLEIYNFVKVVDFQKH